MRTSSVSLSQYLYLEVSIFCLDSRFHACLRLECLIALFEMSYFGVFLRYQELIQRHETKNVAICWPDLVVNYSLIF